MTTVKSLNTTTEVQQSNRTPWLWIPTLYFAEGIPYFMVNTIALIIFKDLGMDNGTLGLITSLISLPWVIKPLWGPFVDILRTKRWWIVTMQLVMTAAFLLTALLIPTRPADGSALPFSAFSWCLIMFCITAFASATHDISADGFYMLALDPHRQSAFVGIRNTFYRIAMVFGQGVLVVLAGLLESRIGNVSRAWSLTLVITALLFAAVSIYHLFILPRPESVPESRNQKDQATNIFRGFGESFKTFFTKDGIAVAIAFMLLYRLPEALSLKMLYPFFSAPVAEGGLALGKEAYGLIYGTFGVVALLLGGILGGLAASKWGLRRCFRIMALSLALPCSVYLIMSIFQPSSLLAVGSFIVVDQFGYGFGFTAYTLYMMYFATGRFTTSHYAICTGFMALSMMLPGMISGYLQEMLGYRGFFWLVMACCLATVAVTEIARRRVAPGYGQKVIEKE